MRTRAHEDVAREIVYFIWLLSLLFVSLQPESICIYKTMKKIVIGILIGLTTLSCGNTKQTNNEQQVAESQEPIGPTFLADSALLYCQQQCDFGPRTMNSEAHERCGEWIAEKFEAFGMTVTKQKSTLTGYDGTPLQATNIIASYKPEQKQRIMICAHWDSRPWADNDPDKANHKKPVMAANDGASGVGVMLEIARLLFNEERDDMTGVDFICFDAEDWGTPQWAENNDNDADTWALGAQYWAANTHYTSDNKARYGILLDMVGGQGARFYQEGVSLYYAPNVVKKVWQAAETIGYGSVFVNEEGIMITDDHLPVNQKAGIPCIDIIPHYPDCEQSSFGPTWHTVNDDMQHLDKSTLQAVGQTLVQVIYSEKLNN